MDYERGALPLSYFGTPFLERKAVLKELSEKPLIVISNGLNMGRLVYADSRRIPNRMENVPKVSALAADLLAAAGYGPDDADRVGMFILEEAARAVRLGEDFGINYFTVAITMFDDKIRVTVADGDNEEYPMYCFGLNRPVGE